MHPITSRFLPVLMAMAMGVSAQIQTVSSQVIGQGCNVGPVGCCLMQPAPTTLTLQLDAINRRLQLDINVLEGCCGVGVPVRLLAVGWQPQPMPLPQFGPACTLHVAPIVVLATTADCFLINLPVSLPPFTFLAQAAAWITSPFPTPGTGVMTLTDALAISLQ